MTTDTGPKEFAVRVETPAGAFRVGGIAKGAGMIEPMMATMLAFVTTDADVTPALLHRALRDVTDRTFNAITVDGECSTNDTVLALASGAAASPSTRAATARSSTGSRPSPGAGPGDCPWRRRRDQAGRRARDRRRIGRRRDAGGPDHRQLAAREDGDARRRPELGPPGVGVGAFGRAVRARARARAHGADRAVPGRPAVRRSGAGGRGIPAAGRARRPRRPWHRRRRPRVVWTCDLSAEYVRINGEYRT